MSRRESSITAGLYERGSADRAGHRSAAAGEPSGDTRRVPSFRRFALPARVAVTGAEGFIGSHLVEGIVARGDAVRAMVQYNSFDSRGWLDALSPEVLANVEAVPGDVRDAGSVVGFLDGADLVFHLAALIAIPYSYRAPRSYVETNVLGTLNLLEAARALETPRVVHTSSSEVYGTAIRVPIDESHPLQGQSPYSATKIGADKLAEAYALSFGLPVVTLRPFNAFGPRQSTRAIVPTIVTQLAAGRRDLQLGATDPTRDLTYVTDTVDAFLAVGSAPPESVVGRTFNAGSGREVSIGDLAGLIARLMDREEVTVRRAPERLRPKDSEVMRLLSDSSRLRDATGWQPRHSLEEGLAATIAWFSEPANLARYPSAEYTL
jgi:NAD dependent epimerase/dehydratase